MHEETENSRKQVIRRSNRRGGFGEGQLGSSSSSKCKGPEVGKGMAHKKQGSQCGCDLVSLGGQGEGSWRLGRSRDEGGRSKGCICPWAGSAPFSLLLADGT